MSRARTSTPRLVGLLAAAALAAGGLSACREFPDDGGSAKGQASVVREVPPAPEVASTTVPVTPTPAPPTEDPGQGGVLGTTASSEDEDEDEAAGPGGESDERPLEPWRLVGRPYLVDDEAPAMSPDGLTTFTLWFRTVGEFRGVRAGTSVTDDRHYKVGLISLPGLPGYVPGGVGMLQRSDEALRAGRYCYTAEVHLRGQRGSKRFAIRRDGAEQRVEFDLRGAPVQRRTAPVVVRDVAAEDAPVTAVERALGCR